MKAILNLDGYISNWDYYDEYISLKKVKATLGLQSTVEDPLESVTIYLNCYGGEVPEGLAIYDYLLTLKVPTNVVITGLAASMGAVLAMVGTSRLISENSEMLIHPVSGYGEGTKEDLRAAADILEKYGDKINAIYTKVTNQTTETIAGYMNTETWLNASRCVEEGFCTGLYTTATARLDARNLSQNQHKRIMNAYRERAKNQPENKQMKNDKEKEKDNLLTTIKNQFDAFLKSFAPKNALVSLKDGGSVFIDTTAEAPAIGAKGDSVYKAEDKAEAAANGDYVAENGTTFTVTDGVITTYTEAATNSSDAAKDKEIADLKQQVADLTGQASNSLKESQKKEQDLLSAFNSLKEGVEKTLGQKFSVDPSITNESGKVLPTSQGTQTVQKPLNAIERKRAREEAEKNQK